MQVDQNRNNIVNALRKETKPNSGLHVPSDIEKSKDIHFAIVNVDFKNDNPRHWQHYI